MNKKNITIVIVAGIFIITGIMLKMHLKASDGFVDSATAVGVSSSCQNFPPPSFCPGGKDDIVANGTDKNRCTIWACKSKTEHYIITDASSSAKDKKIITGLKSFLAKQFGTSQTFSVKNNRKISKQDLNNRVSVFVFDGKALVINKEADYGIVMKDPPLTGTPAITDYLSGTVGIFVVQRDSSQVAYNDLRKELFNNCKNAGEFWHVMPSTRYNVCCKGFNFVSLASVSGEKCATNPEYIMCSNCGNGICEKWENKCNCKKDCK